jgi:hypothetical protein
MTNKPDDVTKANEEASREFNGKDVSGAAKPKEENVQDVNEAANREFNGEAEPDIPGNQVGGLRGSSD